MRIINLMCSIRIALMTGLILLINGFGFGYTQTNSSASLEQRYLAENDMHSATNSKNVLLVCIYEDNFIPLEGGNTSHYWRFKATVVYSYKGGWDVSEKGTFEVLSEGPAPKVAPNSNAGNLMYVFIDEHTPKCISLDNGDYFRYNSDREQALSRILP